MTLAQITASDNLKHAAEFTKIENSALVYALRGWFAALVATPGAIEAGDNAWSFTTLLEHYNSKLNQNPSLRTPEDLSILKQLQIKAKLTQDLVDLLANKNPEDERMNEDVDSFVLEILRTV